MARKPKPMKAVYLGGHPDEHRPGKGHLWIEDDKLIWEGWMLCSNEGWRHFLDAFIFRSKEKGVRLETEIATVTQVEALNNDQLRGAPTWGLGAGGGGLGIGVGLGTKRNLPLGLGKLTHMVKITTVDEFGGEWVVGFGGEWLGRDGDQIFAPIEHELKLARRELRRRSSVT
jgi:hypothetical protein